MSITQMSIWSTCAYLHWVSYGQVTLNVPHSNSSTPTFKYLFVLHFELKYTRYIVFLIFLNIHTIYTPLIGILKSIFVQKIS